MAGTSKAIILRLGLRKTCRRLQEGSHGYLTFGMARVNSNLADHIINDGGIEISQKKKEQLCRSFHVGPFHQLRG